MLASDSTCVYYQISDGLIELRDTTAKHLKVNKREKLDVEIEKNRRYIEEAALCGTSITITKRNKNETPSQ